MKKLYFDFKNSICNKKGGIAIPMIPIVIAFVIIIMGCIEYFILVAGFNDIQSILDTVANSALRVGVDPELHKDEIILDSSLKGIDQNAIRIKYRDLLYKNLEKSIAKNSFNDINTDFSMMTSNGTGYSKATNFRSNPTAFNCPEISVGKTGWSNTFVTTTKDIDTVILDAVVRVDFKATRFVPNRLLKYTFTRKNATNASGLGKVTVDVQNDRVGFTSLLIRSSTRMILK